MLQSNYQGPVRGLDPHVLWLGARGAKGEGAP